MNLLNLAKGVGKAALVGADAALGLGNFIRGASLQNKAWRREDNAVQRRVADLRAAGLSPTLAAGSAAASSSPISLNAPTPGASISARMTEEGARKLQLGEQLRQARDISKTEWETDLIKSQLQRNAYEMMPWQALYGPGGRNMTDLGTGGSVAEVMGISMLRQRLAEQEEAEQRARQVKAAADLTETNAADAARNLALLQPYGIRSGVNMPLLNLSDLLRGPAAKAAKKNLSDKWTKSFPIRKADAAKGR